MDLDLRDPRDLELAERSAAAVARALAHDPTLRFQRHLLHRGRRVVPVRAPHAHPDIDTQDRADLRGGADAVALRLLLSDQATYRRHRPDGAIAEILYEILEQFRVEALAPAELRGVSANLEHRFANWSQAYIDAGLLENEQGILLFAAIHVCRSRILGTPIPERVNDHTESTRAGIYQVLGRNLTGLRPSIDDQDAFDRLAAELATAIDELAGSATGQGAGSRSVLTVLAMLALDEPDPDDPDGLLVTTGNRGSRRDEASGYRIFTTEFDRVADVGELVSARALVELRTRLDEIEAEHRGLAAFLARSVQTLFPAPIDWAWESELEEGRLDPRLLARLAQGSPDSRVFTDRLAVDAPQAAVTILVDISGSMKAVIEPVAAFVDLLARALDRVDVVTEILGFTTGAWNGGRARTRWLGTGRPPQPGRLNEACHIVFASDAASWRSARHRIAGMLWTPMFREGIDGEAVDWAARRLAARPVDRRYLIVISDGSPMDGATSLANGESYLDEHLAEVIGRIEAEGRIHVFGLGIGHDMSSYLQRSRVVDPEAILTRDVAASVLAFLAVDSRF